MPPEKDAEKARTGRWERHREVERKAGREPAKRARESRRESWTRRERKKDANERKNTSNESQNARARAARTHIKGAQRAPLWRTWRAISRRTPMTARNERCAPLALLTRASHTRSCIWTHERTVKIVFLAKLEGPVCKFLKNWGGPPANF